MPIVWGPIHAVQVQQNVFAQCHAFFLAILGRIASLIRAVESTCCLEHFFDGCGPSRTIFLENLFCDL